MSNNNKCILCQVSMFSVNQRVILKDGDYTKEIGMVDMGVLEETIANLCNKYKVNKVKLLGSSKFLRGVADAITTYSIKKYNNNNIEVEIN